MKKINKRVFGSDGLHFAIWKSLITRYPEESRVFFTKNNEEMTISHRFNFNPTEYLICI